MAPTFSYDARLYPAALDRVTDGDTYRLIVDHGMRIRSEQAIRLRGVDTPEIFSGTDEERALGQEAALFAERWLHAATEGRFPLLLVTRKDKETFNRYEAEVWNAATGESLADALVAAGHEKVRLEVVPAS